MLSHNSGATIIVANIYLMNFHMYSGPSRSWADGPEKAIESHCPPSFLTCPEAPQTIKWFELRKKKKNCPLDIKSLIGKYLN